VQDSQCTMDLMAYLDCSSDGGVMCVLALTQSTNAASKALGQCVGNKCFACM